MITIDFMKETDIEEVFEIELESFSVPWDKKSFYDEMSNKLAIYIVAREDGKIIGYAGMWHVVTEGHITNVAVCEEHRQKGVGSLLMEKFIEIGKQKEMIGLTLEVRIGNENAMRLYSKYGFKPEGIRKNYYADTKEDAVIMWLYF